MISARLKNISLLAVITAMVLISSVRAHAQVDAQLTQYWAVPAYYNPSAIGTTDYIHITAGSRLQWVGIPKAPQSFMIMADSPFKLFGKRMGAGLNLQQENYGLYKSLNVGAQVAYKQKLFKGMLSIGLQVGFVSQTFLGTQVYIPSEDEYHESNDDAIPQQDLTGTGFDTALGVHFTHKYFWVGLSARHLTETAISLKTESKQDESFEFKYGRTFYFMAGGNIPIKNTLFELQPSAMVKTDLNFVQAEVTARVRYNKFISGGIAYRYKDAISLLVGAEFKNFFVGYSYDYATSAVAKASSGSHEAFISYNVKLNLGDKNRNKHKSIRIM